MSSTSKNEKKLYYKINNIIDFIIFTVIKNGFGSYKEVLDSPVDKVRAFYDYLIFNNKIEKELLQ